MLDHDRIPEPDPRAWARVTTYESQSSELLENVLRLAVDETIPAGRELPGWKGAMALATEERGKGIVITFWDSVETLISSGRAMHARVGDEQGFVGVTTSVERLEIVHDERAE